MTKQLETLGGEHLRDVIAKAAEIAAQDNEDVAFEFNGTTFTVAAGESYDVAKARAETVFGFPIQSREVEAAAAKADTERTEREWAAQIAAAGVDTEAQMRAQDVPWFKSAEELTRYIEALVTRPHDYGTCVYAMSMAAVAAFQYVAGVLGVTGFQASCADLDIVRRTRHLKGPFILMNGEDLLYPQYDLRAKLDEFVTSAKPWLADEARKHLADSATAHPNVRRHWEELAQVSAGGVEGEREP